MLLRLLEIFEAWSTRNCCQVVINSNTAIKIGNTRKDSAKYASVGRLVGNTLSTGNKLAITARNDQPGLNSLRTWNAAVITTAATAITNQTQTEVSVKLIGKVTLTG